MERNDLVVVLLYAVGVLVFVVALAGCVQIAVEACAQVESASGCKERENLTDETSANVIPL